MKGLRPLDGIKDWGQGVATAGVHRESLVQHPQNYTKKERDTGKVTVGCLGPIVKPLYY